MEQTKAQEDQDASITRSAEFMMKKLATEGFFSYLPADKGDIEQTVRFIEIMKDCDVDMFFVNSVFELYKSFKAPLEDFKPEELGRKLEVLMSAVESLLMGHVAFCANDLHGVS